MDNRMSLLTSPFVPEGMVDLMKKLSKGVIKERPTNMYEYAAVFFEKMLIERDGSLDKGYGKFRSYAEYCKFMDKMDQRRLNETIKRQEITDTADTTDAKQEDVVPPSNIVVQGVAIQGVERKSKDSVKNVSINPKYKSQSEKTTKPVVSNAKNVKTKPRKLSSKKPSESLIVIKEETSADVDDNGNNGESNLHRAAATIQKAFRMYLSKRNSQDDGFVEASGKISHLSEDAAAFIIQKAFKSLILKLKPAAPSREKTDEESIDTAVVPAAEPIAALVAGQENDIIIDKNITKNDENSEQILSENIHEDTKQDLELQDNQIEDAVVDTATTSQIKMSENHLVKVKNIEVVTASSTGTQQIESEEIKIGEFTPADSASDECHDSLEVSALEIKGSSGDHDIISPKDMEIPKTFLAAMEQTESVGREIASVNSQVENISDDALATTVVSDGTPTKPNEETEADEATDPLDRESKLKQLTKVASDTEVNNVSNECEQATVRNVSERDSDVDRPIVTDFNETIVAPKMQEQLVEMAAEETEIQSTAITLSKNASDENTSALEEDRNRNHPKNDFQEKLSTDAEDDKHVANVEEKLVEPQSKEQLFLVEKDGIYVNLDLLQEKFDAIAIDDGTGSDSEKSFKLNILEREEILVNQENVQQIIDDRLTTDDGNLDIESSIVAAVKNMEIGEEMESTDNNIDIKDEEGNEEYELAETVVLVDIPSIIKSNRENEHLLPITTNENESADAIRVDVSAENQEPNTGLKCETSTKQNMFNDELDKLESKTVEKPSEPMKILDCVSDDIHKTEDSDKFLMGENDIGEVDATLANMKDQLNKTEEAHPASEEILIFEEVLTKDKDVDEADTANEHVEEQLNKHVESHTSSNSDENLKKKNVMEEVETKKENVEGELNKIIVEVNNTSDSEDISKKDTVIKDVNTKHENIVEQPNKIEESHKTSDSEDISKTDTVIEDVNSKHMNHEDQLNKIEESHIDSEDISKKETVIEDVNTKHKNGEDQLNKIEESHQTSDSEDISNPDTVIEDVNTKHGNVVEQLNTIEETHTVTSNSKENCIDEKETMHEHVVEQLSKDRDAALDYKITSSEATTEQVTETENQLSETDKTDKIEHKVVPQEAQNEFQKTEAAAKVVFPKDDTVEKRNENEELVKAATIIQKVFRGYVVRSSQTKQNAQTNSNKSQLELSAALIIQKHVRGYLVRRHRQKANKFSIVRVDEKDTNVTDDNSNNEVAPQLPAYSNRFLIPKDSFLERESFADDEDYTRTCKELAATSIQKTYRGYRVRRSLKASTETDAETDVVPSAVEGDIQSSGGNDQIETVVTEAEQVISAVLNVAADVLPLETYDTDSFEDEAPEDKKVELEANALEHESVLGQAVQDNIHVEGQMQQKYNQMSFQDSAINPIEEMSDSSEHPESPRIKSTQNVTATPTLASESVESKYDGSKSFSYEQLSSDLSDTEENKRESLKESEVDETSRDERDELSEVENFDLSSCGEDSLEAMYYSLRKNEIMVDRMHKQVAEQRDPRTDEVGCRATENLKVEFPERVTENLEIAMQQVFKSLESSSDCDGGKKDEDDNSSTLELGLDDSSSINDEKEIETSRHIKRSEDINLDYSEQSELTSDIHAKDDEDGSQSSGINFVADAEMNINDQSQQSDSSFNSSTRFIMKSQSVSEDMMNPIMFAMKRKQALLDQLHVRPYALQENLSEEDHDAFPEHLLSDIDIGNIQRKIFASSVSETDSDYIEQNVTSRRLVRDDFNISTALDHLSTDSDSTIVSAATKIQAGARGFLTRRRLRRSSAGGTSISFEKRYSFGNAAIDKSLEDLIKRQEQINLDGAALKIQQEYRRYQARKNILKKVSPIREQTLELSGGSSVEGIDDNIGITEITFVEKRADNNQQSVEENKIHPISLNIDEVDTVRPIKRTPVNQRRLTLQRGDAVQQNSRPDSQDLNVKEGNHSSSGNQSYEKSKDSETGEYTGTIINKQDKKVTAYITIQSLINRGIGPRQRSMPVQIDSELMRIIPKHLRKRVKSADIAKKKSN